METGIMGAIPQFVDLSLFNIVFLIILGFLGGLTSGFIGSGGAFILTPGMMSLGVSAPVAVATNMCHKFPKAMIGAYRRFRYGQVDVKMGLILAASAVAGVQVGIKILESINENWGAAGSALYVSVVFVFILTLIGLFMLRDSRKSMKSSGEDQVCGLARWVQRVHIPPMIRFKLANTTVSLWVTLPVGFATGLLAGTIAVGGFVGVPGMIYILGAPALVASATEMLLAFSMGLVGTVSYSLAGFVDIRMVILILVGSLFGVQLGAIGTTYVKNYMVKFTMALTMVMVSVSRLVAIPVYMHDLGIIGLSKNAIPLLTTISFVTMCASMLVAGVIILTSMVRGRRTMARQIPKQAEVPSKGLS